VAYKRKTTKTGRITRRSMTTNTNGPSTFSNSMTSGNVTTTHTSKGGKYYTTQTIRRPDGTIEKKRTQSSQAKSNKPSESGGLVLLVFVVIVILGFLFG
jgi:cobalamin biosynthesis Mg chelatase CobN